MVGFMHYMKLICIVTTLATSFFAAAQAAPITINMSFQTSYGDVGSGTLTYDNTVLLDLQDEFDCSLMVCKGYEAYLVEQFHINIFNSSFSGGSSSTSSPFPVYLFSPSLYVMRIDHDSRGGVYPHVSWEFQDLATIFWFLGGFFSYQSAYAGNGQHITGSVAFSMPPSPEVPLPAAAWLMVAGLGGLWAASKKAKNGSLSVS